MNIPDYDPIHPDDLEELYHRRDLRQSRREEDKIRELEFNDEDRNSSFDRLR